MKKILRWSAFFLLLLLLLPACSSRMQPVGRLGEMSLEEFMAALRWKRFGVAANLMQEEFRAGFRQTFAAVPEIHITDVRLVDVASEAEGRRFTATLDMDYYILPSISVKTFRFEQTWGYFDGKAAPRQGFLITSPFPPFP